MGGDLFLLMEEGEIEKAKIYLSNICFEGGSSELCILAPPLDESYKDDPGDCWITFEGDVIHIGHTMNEFSRHWATAIACGIRDNFKVKKCAWESIEEGSEADHRYFLKMRPCQGAICIITEAQERHPGFKSNLFDKPEGDIAVYKKLQKLYEDKIKKLFKGAKSVK